MGGMILPKANYPAPRGMVSLLPSAVPSIKKPHNIVVDGVIVFAMSYRGPAGEHWD